MGKVREGRVWSVLPSLGMSPLCLSQWCCAAGFGQAQLGDGVGLWKGSGRGLRPKESMWPSFLICPLPCRDLCSFQIIQS